MVEEGRGACSLWHAVHLSCSGACRPYVVVHLHKYSRKIILYLIKYIHGRIYTRKASIKYMYIGDVVNGLVAPANGDVGTYGDVDE